MTRNAGTTASLPRAAQRSRSAARYAIDVASRAGWAFSVRSRTSAGPSNASWAIRSPRAASAAVKTAEAARDVVASALPMPTDWEPWPGKTKAEKDIVLRLAAETSPTRAGLCDIARKTGSAGILRPMRTSGSVR